MDWLIELLSPKTVSLANTILLYSFVIFAGIYLGKIKIFGVSLGVTFVLFVGLLMGHLGYSVQADTLHFLREFGLILFIFSIGMQVGPGFFSSFKEGGIRMNGLPQDVVHIDLPDHIVRRPAAQPQIAEHQFHVAFYPEQLRFQSQPLFRLILL